MYYNKDMARELGITIPEKWDDMETFFLNQGVKIINEDRVGSDLDCQEAVDITTRFKEWYSTEMIVEDVDIPGMIEDMVQEINEVLEDA